MPCRKIKLVKNELYHIYNKSIADFKIFDREEDYERMKDGLLFYSVGKPACSFSFFRKLDKTKAILELLQNDLLTRIVDIIAYCLMPTHIHFILKEIREGGISKFMESISKSYSQYFNFKHGRKGPLWESRFNNVLVKTDVQFIHVTRYIHLNPVTAYLVNRPQDWKHSSYREYIGLATGTERICSFAEYLTMEMKSYKNFVDEQIEYQRALAATKTIS